MNNFAKFHIGQIESDLSWREQEMAILRKQLLQTTPGSVQEVTLLRANLAMIYAHYEGFCKFSLGVYIDALDKLSLRRIDLNWSIAAQSLTKFRDDLDKIKDSGDYFKKLFMELEAAFNEKAVFDRPDNIANLWPDLLISWQNRLGLGTQTIQSEQTKLATLVRTRNDIAHGKKLKVSNRAELDSYANAAVLAMHEVAIEIADALENKLYLRHAKVMTIFPHAIS